jgi:hypothetical protein
MDHPKPPQGDLPGASSKVPSLIHDYRAQRDAWREQARNLARMREEVLAAADSEARDIVSAARADVRNILLKARRDLLVLAAQVRAAGRLGEAEDTPDTINFLPSDDLGHARDVLTTARNDVRRVLDESRPELEGLAAEGEALRSALRPRPVPPTPLDVRRHISAPPIVDVPDDRLAETPVDFEFTSIGGDEAPDLMLTDARRPVRAFIAAVATLGALAVMGTGWWLLRSPDKAVPAATGSSSTAATAAGPGRAENSVAPATRAAADSSLSTAGSGLSIRLAARGTSWIRVTADGRVAAEREFKAGETQVIRAAREISVRAGDAGAVTVAVGGKPPVALGRGGEVVTRRFAVDAAPAPRVQPPTPPAAAPITPNPSVPIARSVPQQPPPTAPALPTTALATSAPAPRVTDQSPVSAPPSFVATIPPAAASAPPRPAPTPTAAAPSLAAATPPSAATTQTSLQDSLTNAMSRWLDAYHRGDRATMAAISQQTNVADDRGEKERLPRGLAGVRRSLEDVRFQFVSSQAMLTARMTERVDDPSASQMAVSLVSLMWTQRSGAWQLYDVRIVSAASLSRTFR